MIGGFLGGRSILVRITKNVRGACDHFHFDFLYVVSLDVVFLDRLRHGGERRVAERFDRETLHTAIENAIVRLPRVGKILHQRLAVESGWLSFVLHMLEHGKESLLAIDDVFRPGKSIARKER